MQFKNMSSCFGNCIVLVDIIVQFDMMQIIKFQTFSIKKQNSSHQLTPANSNYFPTLSFRGVCRNLLRKGENDFLKISRDSCGENLFSEINIRNAILWDSFFRYQDNG